MADFISMLSESGFWETLLWISIGVIGALAVWLDIRGDKDVR